jgi:hypothetical protein
MTRAAIVRQVALGAPGSTAPGRTRLGLALTRKVVSRVGHVRCSMTTIADAFGALLEDVGEHPAMLVLVTDLAAKHPGLELDGGIEPSDARSAELISITCSPSTGSPAAAPASPARSVVS